MFVHWGFQRRQSKLWSSECHVLHHDCLLGTQGFYSTLLQCTARRTGPMLPGLILASFLLHEVLVMYLRCIKA